MLLQWKRVRLRLRSRLNVALDKRLAFEVEIDLFEKMRITITFCFDEIVLIVSLITNEF